MAVLNTQRGHNTTFPNAGYEAHSRIAHGILSVSSVGQQAFDRRQLIGQLFIARPHSIGLHNSQSWASYHRVENSAKINEENATKN